MAEKPILFSAPMVRALLDGTKTQTRRVVKLPEGTSHVHVDPGGTVFGPGPYIIATLASGEGHPRIRCPYGKPGDRLWVREAFAPRYFDDGKPGYRADWDGRAADLVREPKWKPSIHMPRELSRITLEITDVRVEGLQDISDEDARAEGCQPHPLTSVLAFAELWESINGKGAWKTNPFCWAISFKRVEHVTMHDACQPAVDASKVSEVVR